MTVYATSTYCVPGIILSIACVAGNKCVPALLELAFFWERHNNRGIVIVRQRPVLCTKMKQRQESRGQVGDFRLGTEDRPLQWSKSQFKT